MVKLIGALLVAGAFSAAGMRGCITLRHRADTLAGVLSALELLKTEICFNMLPLKEAALSAADGCSGEASSFLKHAAGFLDSDTCTCFLDAWNEGINELVSLNSGDLRIIRDAGAILGRCSAEEQCEWVSSAMRRLEMRLSAAERERDEKGKLYRTLGVGLGVMTALILI